MNSKFCRNNACEYNNHAKCAAVNECPGYEPVDCTKCLKEFLCNWNPDVCKFVPDLDAGKEKE